MSLAIELNKRITLQAPMTGQDDYGAPLTGWTDVVSVWASIEDISGREFVAANATQNGVQTKITIRYRDGVVAAMRVLHGAVVYNIEAVLGQDRRELLLMCSRGVNDG
jgi:SPP1 family predicted phage head-tail adaptor